MSALSKDFRPNLLHPFYFNRRGLAEAVEALAGNLSGNLMDFGCGTKPYKSLFNVTNYVGVDFVNEGHPHENEQIDIFYDGVKIPVADYTFDSVLSSEVFEHIFNLEEILKEIHRVTKPGGKVLITCPFVWNEHEVPYDYARYSRFALTHLFNKSGFDILEFRKTGNFVQSIFQLCNLYTYTLYMKKHDRFFFIRWIFKMNFLITNLLGRAFDFVLPENHTMYLNNVFLLKRQ